MADPKDVPARPVDQVFAGRRESIAAHRCTLCSKEIMGFRDEISAREYRLSGMCQTCQDEFFDPDL